MTIKDFIRSANNLFEQNEIENKILIFVGVNGSGKTTTIGKIANQIGNEKKM